jgi:hypothetical protein
MTDLDDIIALATLMNAEDDPSEALTHRLRGLSDNDCYLRIAASELLQGKSYVAFSSDPKILAGYRETRRAHGCHSHRENRMAANA